MTGECRPSLRKKTLRNVMLSNLSVTDKECISAIFERYEAKEELRGRWMDNEDYMFCSCCGMQWNYCDNDTQDFHYCPNCGCKMDLEG